MKFSDMSYSRPDIQVLANRFNDLLGNFDAAETAEKQKEVLSSINELKNEFHTLSSLASVRNSINTQDPFYEAEQAYFDTNEPVLKDLNVRFYKALGNSRFKDELEKSSDNNCSGWQI
ncbi:MAG: hypothetical protein U0T75_01425 [Chitinophagales bacterium]